MSWRALDANNMWFRIAKVVELSLIWLQNAPGWAGKPLGEYSRRGGRVHVGEEKTAKQKQMNIYRAGWWGSRLLSWKSEFGGRQKTFLRKPRSWKGSRDAQRHPRIWVRGGGRRRGKPSLLEETTSKPHIAHRTGGICLFVYILIPRSFNITRTSPKQCWASLDHARLEN